MSEVGLCCLLHCWSTYWGGTPPAAGGTWVHWWRSIQRHVDFGCWEKVVEQGKLLVVTLVELCVVHVRLQYAENDLLAFYIYRSLFQKAWSHDVNTLLPCLA